MEEKVLQNTALHVDVAHIDLEPGPYCMSYHFNLEPLKASIDNFGVLNPPYLLKNSQSTFVVVAGYRRLLAVRDLGWPEVMCQVLPDNFSPFKALLLNLNDNLIHRQLNNIEKSMVLERLTRFLKGEEIEKEFMPILGLPANKETLKVFLGLEGLEETIRVSVATQRLSPRVAGLMEGLVSEDRLKISDLFTFCKWSFNQQWEAVQWIIEIGEREGRSIREIIDEEEIKEVLHSERINNPQKIKRIVKYLKARRFPSLTKAQKLFQKGLSELSLPLGIQILAPPFFEANTYKLEITFTEGKKLKETVTELSHVSGLERITDFWKESEGR